MENINVKIHEYNEDTHAILVSFSSEKYNPPEDKIKYFSFDLDNFTSKNQEGIMKELSNLGIKQIEIELAKEESKNDTSLVSSFKNLVGTTVTSKVQDVVPTHVSTLDSRLLNNTEYDDNNKFEQEHIIL